jgi:protein-tyrosine-phosphatase
MKILCVDTEDTNFNPMLKALLKEKLKEDRNTVIKSAAILEDRVIHKADSYAIACMAERNLNITNHQSSRIRAYEDLTQFDCIICLTEAQKKYLKNKFSHLPSVTAVPYTITSAAPCITWDVV